MFESAECWAGIVDVVGAGAVLEVLSQQSVRVPQAHSRAGGASHRCCTIWAPTAT
jgi:hypothetical protein